MNTCGTYDEVFLLVGDGDGVDRVEREGARVVLVTLKHRFIRLQK